jgi:hypothetical protein
MKGVKCYLLSTRRQYNGPRHSNDKRYNSFYIREVTLRDGTMMMKWNDGDGWYFHSEKKNDENRF